MKMKKTYEQLEKENEYLKSVLLKIADINNEESCKKYMDENGFIIDYPRVLGYAQGMADVALDNVEVGRC